MGRAPGGDRCVDADRRRSGATTDSERRLPAVAVVGIRRVEEGHRMDGTGPSVEAATESPDERATVFLAECAVQQEIAGCVHRYQEIENVTQGQQ